MASRKIVWTKTSLRQFETTINYIALDSERNAIKVMNNIIAALTRTIDYPEFYRPDKYKKITMAVTARSKSIVTGFPIELPKMKYVC